MRIQLLIVCLFAVTAFLSACVVSPAHPATGARVRVSATTQPTEGWACVVFLSTARVDDAFIDELIAEGVAVIQLDSFRTDLAGLADRLLELRKSLVDPKARTLAADVRVDPNRVYILPSGYRIARDVEFARAGDRVLKMDVAYPSRPEIPVPTLMEITCDNVNRMGGFSLMFCRDTLLDGGAVRGFAVAMIDHPVAPPYKGIDDPMPQALELTTAATKKLREMSGELKLSGKIAAIGFSRGGPFAAMLAGRGDVEAALVHGNRYDYSKLAADDPMLGRFARAWGPIEADRDRWIIHGAVAHLTGLASPMFLNTSDAESPEYRLGLSHLADALKARDVSYIQRIDADGRGHQVTRDDRRLEEIYEFFHLHLRTR